MASYNYISIQKNIITVIILYKKTCIVQLSYEHQMLSEKQVHKLSLGQ